MTFVQLSLVGGEDAFAGIKAFLTRHPWEAQAPAGTRPYPKAAADIEAHQVAEGTFVTGRFSWGDPPKRRYATTLRTNDLTGTLTSSCDCGTQGLCSHAARLASDLLVRPAWDEGAEQQAKLAAWLRSAEASIQKTPPVPDPVQDITLSLRLSPLPGRPDLAAEVEVRVGPGRKLPNTKPAPNLVRRDHPAGLSAQLPAYFPRTDLLLIYALLAKEPCYDRVASSMQESSLSSLMRQYPTFVVGTTGSITQVTQGEDRHISYEWVPGSDGSQRLRYSICDAPADTLILSAHDFWYFSPSQALLGRLHGDTRLLPSLNAAPVITFHQAEQAYELVRNSPACTIVPLPKSSRRTLEVAHQPAPHLIMGSSAKGGLWAQLSIRYGGHQVSPFKPEELTAVERDDITYMVRRDLAAEALAIQHLSALASAPSPYLLRAHQLPADAWLAEGSSREDAAGLLRQVPHLKKARFSVEIDASFPLALADANPVWKTTVEDGGGKFAKFSIGIEVNGRRYSILAIAKAALLLHQFNLVPQPGEPDEVVLRLDDNACVTLPLGRLRRLMVPLLEWRNRLDSEGVITIRKIEQPILQAAIESATEWHSNVDTDALVRAADLVRQDRSPPAGFNGTFKEHQWEAYFYLNWLAEVDLNGLNCDQQRMGKTVVTLAHCAKQRSLGRLTLPILITAPASVCDNWCEKIAQYLPGWKTTILKSAHDRVSQEQLAGIDFVCVSWTMLANNPALFANVRFGLVLRDEVQDIKNSDSKAWQALAKIQADRHISLSGTPALNSPMEWWAQLESLEPGYMGNRDDFRRRYSDPITQGDDDALDRLRARLKPLCFRRTRQDIAGAPAEPEMLHVHLQMSTRERDLYEVLHAQTMEEIHELYKKYGNTDKGKKKILGALQRIRRYCVHPQLTDDGRKAGLRDSVKFDKLRELLRTMVKDEERVIIFSQWTTALDLIKSQITDALGFRTARFDGEMSRQSRNAELASFRAGNADLLLVSMKAGGAGLDMYEATASIFVDNWWNHGVEDQAADRMVSLDDFRQKRRVHLLYDDTIEMGVKDTADRKGNLMQAIWSGGSLEKLDFTAADLIEAFTSSWKPAAGAAVANITH